jgi:hypothetical protein
LAARPIVARFVADGEPGRIRQEIWGYSEVLGGLEPDDVIEPGVLFAELASRVIEATLSAIRTEHLSYLSGVVASGFARP